MIVLVTGGRDYSSYERVSEILGLLNQSSEISLVVQGGALGADSLAVRWCKENGVQYCTFPAMWPNFGRGAGHRRNASMIDSVNLDMVIAFPGGSGTRGCVDYANTSGVKVEKVDW